MSDAPQLAYDPYEWFDPECGRPVRRAIISEIVAQVTSGQLVTVKRAADYLESLSGVRRVSNIPLDRLAVTAKAMQMLMEERRRNA